MPALFDLMEHEASPAVRAVLGHWLLGYLHLHPDGSGRIARFLRNAMRASGGYPSALHPDMTVIRVDDRDSYLAALDAASVDADIRRFTAFIDRSRKRTEVRTAPGPMSAIPMRTAA
jgi:Fic family protein